MSPAAGRLVRVSGPLVEAEGVPRVAVADVVEVGPDRLAAEVVAVEHGRLTAQVYEYTGGLRVGDPVAGLGRPLSARLGPGLLGGVFDGLLRPLADRPDRLFPGSLRGAGPSRRWNFVPTASAGTDVAAGALLGTIATSAGIDHRVLVPTGVSGAIEFLADGEVADEDPVAVVAGQPVPLVEVWPVRAPRPVGDRLELSVPFLTGQRVVDLLFPIAKGATAAVPGGFGTGKTVLLQQLVKWCEADVVVFVGCGERGNELADALADLAELEDPRSGHRLLERTVVIANTSNMPVMAREASIYTGMTVAEYFRDMGYDAVLLADSTSRWAEALREFASRSGELPAEEGFPAGLDSALAAFYERAGRVRTLGGPEGSVTAIGAVSPPGGDMAEPVTAHTERFVRCLWSLDRDLAYARHYPAITWQRSFSRDTPAIGAWHAASGRPGWLRDQAWASSVLAEGDRLVPMVELVGLQALPARERMAVLAARLLRETVLQQSALSPNDATSTPGKQAALVTMVAAIYERALLLLEQGVPVDAIEGLDFSGVTRVRDEVRPDDGRAVERRRDEILATMDALAASAGGGGGGGAP